MCEFAGTHRKLIYSKCLKGTQKEVYVVMMLACDMLLQRSSNEPVILLLLNT